MDYYSGGVNRTLCDTLSEMRKMYETRNFAGLLGLIEEAQTMANRMEAKLYTIKDWKRAESYYKKLKVKIKAIELKTEED